MKSIFDPCTVKSQYSVHLPVFWLYIPIVVNELMRTVDDIKIPNQKYKHKQIKLICSWEVRGMLWVLSSCLDQKHEVAMDGLHDN